MVGRVKALFDRVALARHEKRAANHYLSFIFGCRDAAKAILKPLPPGSLPIEQAG